MVRALYLYPSNSSEKSTPKWHRRDARIFNVLVRDTLLADSDGNIDNSCEGDCEGERSGGGVGVVLGGDSRSVGWLNGSLDCLCLAAATRRGCDLVIDTPSSEMLWLYVRLAPRDCETIAGIW
jgi:hypothetical protein